MFLTLKHIQNEGPTIDLEIDPQKSLIPPTPTDDGRFDPLHRVIR